jgi:hypothetical protein
MPPTRPCKPRFPDKRIGHDDVRDSVGGAVPRAVIGESPKAVTGLIGARIGGVKGQIPAFDRGNRHVAVEDGARGIRKGKVGRRRPFGPGEGRASGRGDRGGYGALLRLIPFYVIQYTVYRGEGQGKGAVFSQPDALAGIVGIEAPGAVLVFQGHVQNVAKSARAAP